MAIETFDRPFEIRRWSDHPEVTNCVSALVGEIGAVELRKRDRGQKDKRAFRQAVRTLILDLYVAWRTNPELEVGIARSKGAFGPGTRLARLFFTYKTFIDAFNGLRRLGYLEVTREGRHDDDADFGKVSRVVATSKLVDRLNGIPLCAIRTDLNAEFIVLRNASKETISYGKTPFTVRASDNLEAINARLTSHWYDLDLSDEEFASVDARLRQMTDDRPKAIDFTQRTLHRVFNNSDWRQGGRFYGAWWQSIPKELRPFVTIDGKETIELDYSGLHPLLLYRRHGIDAPADPYDPVFIGVPGCSNSPEGPDTYERQRQVIKRTFSALLNASKPQVRDPVEDFSEALMHSTWAELQQMIIAAHSPIGDKFGTGSGLLLQREDSDIAERIMLRFRDSQYPCLPVHDSFLVYRALADELQQIMREEFNRGLPEAVEVKIKPKLREQALQGQGLVDPDIGDILTGQGPSSKYDGRWLEWAQYKDSLGSTS